MALGRKLREHTEDHLAGRRNGQRGLKGGKEWLHRVDVDDFLDVMEVFNVTRATADEMLFSCPFPGHSSGDSKPSAYMNDGSKDKSKATVWKCHGCGRAGNAITFYAEMENVSKQQAANDLRDRYAPDYLAPKDGIANEIIEKLRKMHEEPEERPEEVINKIYEAKFTVDWHEAQEAWQAGDATPEMAYLFERGFDADTLTEWDIGWDSIQERITIPVRNEDGDIIGVKGRTTKEKKQEKIKYKILGDMADDSRRRYGFRHYDKSHYLFGLDRVEDFDGKLVLVEGELDVIALWMIGVTAVSSGSAHLSEIQQRLVRDHCDEIVVFFDSDTAGDNATFGYYNKDDEFKPGVVQHLQPFIRVRVVEEHDHDAATMILERGETKKLLKMLRSAELSHNFLLGD